VFAGACSGYASVWKYSVPGCQFTQWLSWFPPWFSCSRIWTARAGFISIGQQPMLDTAASISAFAD
jgi:hypothetical protein